MVTQQQLAQRPAGRAIGFQRWRDLLFMHWRVPVEQLQSAIPVPLQLETFDGAAWIGLVPFAMRGVRPWWSPAIAGISNFLETNVRTYVVHPEAGPGVWFFSLDATSRLAVVTARRFWHLPYFHAQLTLQQQPVSDSMAPSGRELPLAAARTLATRGIRYRSLGRADREGSYDIQVRVPEPSSTAEDYRTAAVPTAGEPSSLPYWLLERYLLYSWDPRRRRLLSGRVHHRPYRWCSVQLDSCQQQLVHADTPIPQFDRMPDHVAYSPGVDVSVFPLQPVHSLARSLRTHARSEGTVQE